ncbi:MAG: aconitate hydratase AcnA [Armatimonadota bacterium]
MTRTISTSIGEREFTPLSEVGHSLDSIPYSIKVLLESALRHLDGKIFTEEHVEALATYDGTRVPAVEIPFTPGRVVLQDFTGVPAVVDLAAMRDAIARLGGDPARVNPLVPCDLVIDHSVQVDAFNSRMALQINAELEFQRNHERYEFLKWGQQAFDNFRVVPPATGIVHQVNLEYLAKVVWDDGSFLYPDSLVGTDSHTTMVNGLGVLGWGVGGIEAEACMLGQPIYMLIPEVVGFRLTGSLREGATATDLVLTVTQMLREYGVVNKFVEFFGPGLNSMAVADRATLANMAPEYGATVGFFPVDDRTLEYLYLTGRDEKLIEMVKQYCVEQGLWRDESHPVRYSAVLELNLEEVEPSLAGPRRPQDRIPLTKMKEQWMRDLATTFKRPMHNGNRSVERWTSEGGAPQPATALAEPAGQGVPVEGQNYKLYDGDVVIAAITSCTNTSNPSVMIAAGLVARRARERGLTRKPWVKTSLAPGSKVVTEYLNKSGLMEDLESLGFYLVGYGCTTCIGNSGPLPEEIAEAVVKGDLVVASVLSGNRNFEGRINPLVRANYLASPPLVVAYAIAGTVDFDLFSDPLGTGKAGEAVYLKDIWPSLQEIQEVIHSSVRREDFIRQYAHVFEGSEEWQKIETGTGSLYQWKNESTYIQHPPFFVGMTREVQPIQPVLGARCLVKVGNSVTTDHISPAGAIAPDSPAGKYLIEKGVQPKDFNSYGSRRGNDQVMTRGTFANVRVRNELAPGTEGGWTTDFTDGQVKSIYEASLSYKGRGIPLVVIAGKDYGMGSSRDWAAKGTFLLGIRAVMAESFERIHRSNLVGMGVLPLTFTEGESAEALGLSGRETFDILVDDALQPRQRVQVVATDEEGRVKRFECIARLDTDVEVEYYRNGGILHTVLRKMI